jgi:hypothetical protein
LPAIWEAEQGAASARFRIADEVAPSPRGGIPKRTGPNTFRFKDKLFDPQNRGNQVGRDWVRCKFRTPQTAKCRAHIRLDGKIGGFGNIRVRGRIGPDDNRLNVVQGTHDFNGVAGKMLFHDLNMNTQRFHFDFVR